tara:strand:- start:18970 stop:19212 length:243 start_codon:yes stop_codon:yes gene_type:complete
MDKYDLAILDIIETHRTKNQNRIKLTALERSFWKHIESETALDVGQSRIGERITNLYLGGLVQNNNGYILTKKGREQLSL